MKKKTFVIGKKYKSKLNGVVYECVRDTHPWDRTKRLAPVTRYGLPSIRFSIHFSRFDRSNFIVVR